VTDKLVREDTQKVVQELLQDKMDVTISEADLDSVRRVPKSKNQQNTGAPRPILVTFVRNSLRQKVISKRRILKGTGIGVHDVLTKTNQFIYNETKKMAKDMNKIQSVWTWNGITIVLLEDKGNKIKYNVRTVKDIKVIQDRHGKD